MSPGKHPGPGALSRVEKMGTKKLGLFGRAFCALGKWVLDRDRRKSQEAMKYSAHASPNLFGSSSHVPRARVGSVAQEHLKSCGYLCALFVD